MGPGRASRRGRPWLRLAPDAATRNVAVQTGDPDSVLATYQRLLAYRRESPPLRRGSMTRLESGAADVLAWTRTAGDESLLVLVNFVGQDRTVDLAAVAPGRWMPLVGTHRSLPETGPDGLRLRPDEAVILAATAATTHAL